MSVKKSGSTDDDRIVKEVGKKRWGDRANVSTTAKSKDTVSTTLKSKSSDFSDSDIPDDEDIPNPHYIGVRKGTVLDLMRSPSRGLIPWELDMDIILIDTTPVFDETDIQCTSVFDFFTQYFRELFAFGYLLSVGNGQLKLSKIDSQTHQNIDITVQKGIDIDENFLPATLFGEPVMLGKQELVDYHAWFGAPLKLQYWDSMVQCQVPEKIEKIEAGFGIGVTYSHPLCLPDCYDDPGCDYSRE